MCSAPEEKISPFLNFAISFKRSSGLPILKSDFTLESFSKMAIASRRGGTTAPAEYHYRWKNARKPRSARKDGLIQVSPAYSFVSNYQVKTTTDDGR
jgi:hypothetical protein